MKKIVAVPIVLTVGLIAVYARNSSLAVQDPEAEIVSVPMTLAKEVPASGAMTEDRTTGILESDVDMDNPLGRVITARLADLDGADEHTARTALLVDGLGIDVKSPRWVFTITRLRAAENTAVVRVAPLYMLIGGHHATLMGSIEEEWTMDEDKARCTSRVAGHLGYLQ